MRTKSVKILPKCDYCGADARYDAPTSSGSAWGYMCLECSKSRSSKSRLSIGTEFVLKASTQAPKPESLEAKVISISLDEIVVRCPTCEDEFALEPDVEDGCCQICGQMVKFHNPLY